MVSAIFFDFYNTLARFYPSLDEIQTSACQELGIKVSKSGIRVGYASADDYMSLQNSQYPLNSMNKEGKDRFFTEYERLVLKGAGLDATPGLAWQIWSIASSVPKEFILFEEVPSILSFLKDSGIILGVISNLRQDTSEVHRTLGLDKYLDFTVTSQETGSEKPHPPIFLAALQKAGIRPDKVIHVGDQYISDVAGALKVGIRPVLIDREGFYDNVDNCTKINNLSELRSLVTT